ncbi:MAG: CPBP family intramembrane metalloprotease, partial [Bacteroidales bacterium]|nr:CPBP family intramembrane metalloprotease [Bacteroidales bacterium]
MTMFREPPFRPLHPFVKILALVMVMIITFLVVLAIGVGFSIPFFGMDLFEGVSVLTDYSDPGTIALLKYLQVVNQIGVFILPAIIFVILTDDDLPGYLRLRGEFRRFSLIFGFILLVVSLPFIGWLLEINADIHLPAALSRIEDWMRTSEDSAEKLTEAFLSSSTWTGFLVNLVMIAVLAAIGEELIFRGILVRLFKEWTSNIHLAVFIPALLFSALHLQFYGFFGRLVLGIILGYLFVWTGSLWVPVIVHFLNNAIAVVVSFMDERGIITTDLKTFGTSQDNGVIVGSFMLM